MNTENRILEVRGIRVEVVRKAIKNLHIGVYPPEGRVRVAAPLRVNDEAVRLAVIARLGWIRRQQSRFAEQPRQSAREMTNGESHYVWGRRYRLRLIERPGPFKVVLSGNSHLDLYIRPGADATQREKALNNWYRSQLKVRIPALITKWEPVIGVTVSEWRIKKMKTKWGSCNPVARRIWLNLELAKKPLGCLEYIMVHEMVHLLERHHNSRFYSLMEKLLPQWSLQRERLRHQPLSSEQWGNTLHRGLKK